MNLFKSQLSKQNAIMAFCPVPSVIITNDGIIEFSNSKANALFEDEDLTNKNILVYLETSIDTLIDAEKSKIILKLKVNNSEKTVEIKSSKLPDEQKYILTLNDITKTHLILQNYLNQDNIKDKMTHQKNIFLIKVANNLKAPLHSIIGFSQAILEGLGGDINEKQEKYLKIIFKNSSELLTLIEKIIELSQVEADAIDYSHKSFDVLNTINNALSNVKSKIEEKKLILNIDTELLEKKTVYTDENLLRKICSTLFENAVNSCDLGSITVRISNPPIEFVKLKGLEVRPGEIDSSYALFEVIDTGAGIPSNEISDIFDPYIQVDKNTKKNLLKGLTLGVTKQLVEKLEGRIWVESELMKESNFSFIIPIEKDVELENTKQDNTIGSTTTEE